MINEIGVLYDRLIRIDGAILRRSLFVTVVAVVGIVCLLIGWLFSPMLDEILAHIPIGN
jgi:hypothetical protein